MAFMSVYQFVCMLLFELLFRVGVACISSLPLLIFLRFKFSLQLNLLNILARKKYVFAKK